MDRSAVSLAVSAAEISRYGSAPADAHSPVVPASVLVDCVELFKIRIVTMVLITGWGGFYLGSLQSGVVSLHGGLLDALLGIGLVSAGAGAMNQTIEHRTDSLMGRTANRPVAAGRLSPTQGWLAGLAALALGVAWLLLRSNLLTMALALLTALTYVAIYTPLKRITPWSTFVGALPGAMGPLLGWTAARGRIEWPGLALFSILFVWQFPHFMSIAWLYRADYARAGFRMWPVVDPGGRSNAIVAVSFAALMVPVSLLPWLLGMTGSLYTVPAFALSLYYMIYTLRFTRILQNLPEVESRRLARELLRASILFLPLLFAALMVCAAVRR
jgi:protoheme IX farnesyltransferase